MAWSQEATILMHDVYLPKHDNIRDALKDIEKEAGYKISYDHFRHLFKDMYEYTASYRLLRKFPLQTSSQFLTNKSIIDQIKEALQSIPRYSPRPKTVVGNHTLVATLSDLHFGKNTSLLESRIKEYTYIIKNLASSKTDEFVLLMLGDMVDGQGIYPGQCYDIEIDPPGQVIATRDSLWRLMVSLRKKAPVRAECVFGNHGRVTQKKDLIATRRSNWDWILYMVLDAMSRISESEISISYADELFHEALIRGYRLLLAHEAIPQVATNARRAKAAGWADIYKFDLMVSAHLHDYSITNYNGRPLIINGAMADPSEFAKTALARTSHPTQLVWQTTDKNLLESIYPIIL